MTVPPDPANWRPDVADLLDIRGDADEARAVRAGIDAFKGLTGAGAANAVRAGLPGMLRRLIENRALSPRDALLITRQAGILTLLDLRTAVAAGRLEGLLGAGMAARLAGAASALELESRPVPIGRALDVLESLIAHLARVAPGLEGLVPAGDVRRTEPLALSLALAGRASDPARALDPIAPKGDLTDVRHRGPRRAIVHYQDVEIDLRIAAPAEFGTMLFRATGSAAHVAAIERRRASLKVTAREEDVYAHAGLPYIPPEMRHASGEIEAAAAMALPPLVEREHIRGDLHLHTSYSDGRDTLDVMVEACAALGYEYIAITDHSERAGAARTVGVDQLARQADEIARIRERYPAMAILHGVEVDIMPDGRLDFSDAVLERLDIVLASLHDSAGHDGRRLTARCLEAIRHPLVNVLTHPGNRIVARRRAYPLDYDAVFTAAADTGTALEVDGAPAHLDLDGEQARQAVLAGATVVIDSDCHRADRLDRQMRLGIGTARRGWVGPADVLNTRPLDAVRAFIAAKRRGRGVGGA